MQQVHIAFDVRKTGRNHLLKDDGTTSLVSFPPFHLKRAETDQGYYDRLIGSRMRAFDWHQYQ